MDQIAQGLPNISPAGGAVGVLLVIFTWLVASIVRRYDKGGTELVGGYKGLAETSATNAAHEREARERADRRVESEIRRTEEARAYAWALETQLGIPHRDWAEVSD